MSTSEPRSRHTTTTDTLKCATYQWVNALVWGSRPVTSLKTLCPTAVRNCQCVTLPQATANQKSGDLSPSDLSQHGHGQARRLIQLSLPPAPKLTQQMNNGSNPLPTTEEQVLATCTTMERTNVPGTTERATPLAPRQVACRATSSEPLDGETYNGPRHPSPLHGSASSRTSSESSSIPSSLDIASTKSFFPLPCEQHFSNHVTFVPPVCWPTVQPHADGGAVGELFSTDFAFASP